jgi:hypothetical protein
MLGIFCDHISKEISMLYDIVEFCQLDNKMQNISILASARRSNSLNEDSVVEAVILSGEAVSVEYGGCTCDGNCRRMVISHVSYILFLK